MSQTITEANAKELFLKAVSEPAPPMPEFSGKGFILCAGGPYTVSAYVVARLLRHYGTQLPIELWHAGHDEVPENLKPAFAALGVIFHDVMDYCQDRPLKQMRGFPIKTAALIHSKLKEVMFIDADCFPVRDFEFLFESEEYKQTGSVFFPDNRRHYLLPGKPVWNHTDMPYNGDTEFETGLIVLNKERCWKELNLAEWMSRDSDFWYQHAMGDKDTFYLAWRKLGNGYFLAPKCTRVRAVLTRHYWSDGKHLADHKTGTSKYMLPKKKAYGNSYLSVYKGRPAYKHLIDEVAQRVVNHNYRLHTQFIDELKQQIKY